ncbi:MAG: ABC transporter ATP-binding protein, partial [Agathobacter sp.]|nr:ABC transporter ATP-binding protein [Agathobacter sp.]
MPKPMRGPKPKIENPGLIFKRLMGIIMKKYGVLYGIVVVCIFLNVFATLQGTMFLKTLIDDFITPLLSQTTPDYGPLLQAMMKVAVFYGIGIVAAYLQNRLLITISQGSIKFIRDDLFDHMQDLPIRYFDTHSHGDIMSTYTNDIDTLRQLISQSLPQLVNSGITVIGVFVMMCTLSLPLTLVTIIMVLVTLFITKKFAGFSSRYFLAQQKDLGSLNGFVEEMINGQKVVKVFNHEDANIEEFNKRNDQLF